MLPVVDKPLIQYAVEEAIAAGVPVCAYRRGGVSEIVREGINGYFAVPDNCDELARGVHKCMSLDSERCRLSIVDTFSMDAFAQRVYQFLGV